MVLFKFFIYVLFKLFLLNVYYFIVKQTERKIVQFRKYAQEKYIRYKAETKKLVMLTEK